MEHNGLEQIGDEGLAAMFEISFETLTLLLQLSGQLSAPEGPPRQTSLR